ncbi:uncharacterized protein LOC111519053 [Drosophila willistoni]|uniref:uncharacterized protein LOC111519053 n=1 Tax=Drosophila willistoni TaxID=7260 RepID=UPI000C26D250|nr:uncharacterized protein LOC111519053 [Drosophila willistoni]
MYSIYGFLLTLTLLISSIQYDVTAEPLKYCSLIKSSNFMLSIRDLGRADLKSDLYMNVTEVEDQTVDQFLSYLQEAKNILLSSHSASVKLANDKHFASVPMDTPVCEVIDVSSEEDTSKVQYTLYVGAMSTSVQILAERFLNGLIYDEQSLLFKVTDMSPITFDKSYQPIVEQRDEVSLIRQTIKAHGNKDFLDTISTLILDAKYDNHLNNGSKSKYNARFDVVSLISKKTEILIDKDKIELSRDFRDKIYAAANMQNLSNLNRTKEIIKVLNKFGWYFTNHFDLGGRLDVSTVSNENEGSEEMSGIDKFLQFFKDIWNAIISFFGFESDDTDENKLDNVEAKLGTQWNKLGGNVVISKQDNSEFTEIEHVTSTVKGANDVESFKHNLDNDQKWTIISAKNIIPTCKIFFKKDAHLMGEIRRLIVTYGDNSRIRELQPNINMVEYVNDLWSDYVIPF